MIAGSAVQFQRMKRFRRWLFNGLSVLSLALCLLTLTLWVRSHFGGRAKEDWNLDGHWGQLEVQEAEERGKILVTWNGVQPSPNYELDVMDLRNFREYEFAGMSVFTARFSGAPFVSITLPLWMASSVFGLLFATYVACRFWKRAAIEGHCRVCGYDLRATPDRCPECGTIPRSKQPISI